jgi:hypothetical protein
MDGLSPPLLVSHRGVKNNGSYIPCVSSLLHTYVSFLFFAFYYIRIFPVRECENATHYYATLTKVSLFSFDGFFMFFASKQPHPSYVVLYDLNLKILPQNLTLTFL